MFVLSINVKKQFVIHRSLKIVCYLTRISMAISHVFDTIANDRVTNLSFKTFQRSKAYVQIYVQFIISIKVCNFKRLSCSMLRNTFWHLTVLWLNFIRAQGSQHKSIIHISYLYLGLLDYYYFFKRTTMRKVKPEQVSKNTLTTCGSRKSL